MALITLGSVCLAVTGAEALYADLGHFGRKPIRLAWLGYVFPALVLNYFGQGALVLAHPEAIENPFYRMAPEWALIPMIGLATLATVIASQAVITGAYSLTRQARAARADAAAVGALHLGEPRRPVLHAAGQLVPAGRRGGAGARCSAAPRTSPPPTASR